MEEVKTVNVTLDKNSISILKQVDNIHKSSLINLAISLISKTGYYKTLTGDIGDSLESVTSLDTIGSTNTTPLTNTTGATGNTTTPKPEKKKGSWDDF
jgi:hypothetical protein